jgi:hypothetical protein
LEKRGAQQSISMLLQYSVTSGKKERARTPPIQPIVATDQARDNTPDPMTAVMMWEDVVQ